LYPANTKKEGDERKDEEAELYSCIE